MNKKILQIAAILIIASNLISCATILGGPVSNCQRTAPVAGHPTRQIRAGALIADIILFWPGAIVDFATGAIYRPCNK